MRMESLQRSRRGHKAHITVLRNKITDVIQRNEISELKGLQESLTKAVEKIENLNEQILFLITDESEISKEITETGEYVFSVRVDIHKLNEAITAKLPLTPLMQSKSAGVKLPKLNIKKFSGDFTQWNSFWDIYETSVHKRTDIEGVEKFTYLKGLLEGDALKLVEGFNLETRYYDEAVKLLQDTYGQKTEIKMSFVKKLLQLESPDSCPEALQEFRSNFECQIRSLNALNLTLDELYTILLYCKLPANVSETIKRKAEDNWLNFDIFKKQLESEINNLRAFKGDFSSSSVSSPVSTLVVQNKKTQSVSCPLCKASHYWAKCPNSTTREAKFSKLKELGLCYVCAQKGHSSTKCKKRNCGNGCTFKHHLCLCPKKGGNSKAKGNSKQEGDDKGKVQVTTLAVGSSQKQSTEITYKSVLPTATVTLKGKGKNMIKARGLLDPCSERTFVCRSLLNNLKYKLKGTVKLRLHGYCSSVPEKTYDVVTLYIPYRENLISLESIVVDELPQYNKEFSVAVTLSELRKVKLADKEFNLPVGEQSPIRLLIGVDNVYNILHPGFKKFGKLVLLPSIFGYILTGSYKDKTSVDEVKVVSILKLAITPVENYLEHPSTIENIKTSPSEMESLWSMDHMGICDTEMNNQDKEVLKNFENTVTYSETENQYCILYHYLGK